MTNDHVICYYGHVAIELYCTWHIFIYESCNVMRHVLLLGFSRDSFHFLLRLDYDDNV